MEYNCSVRDISEDKLLANNPDHEPLFALEELIYNLPRVELPPINKFCNGLYARSIFIPKNTVLTGAIHRDECFFIVREGDLLVSDGTATKRYGTGYMCVSKAGSKRAGLALEDTLVTTIHSNPNNETDEDKLWDSIVVSSDLRDKIRN